MASNIKNIDKKMLDSVEARASELMEKYHACAQCSLLAVQEGCRMEDDVMAKAAVVLSGGVGGMRSVCGALTGSALALGMKYGRDISLLQDPPDEAIAAAGKSMEPVAKLAKWFEREFGSIVCSDIQKAHMGTDLSAKVPWQKELIDQLGMRQHCAKIVKKTARRAAAMMDNPGLGLLDEI